MHRDALGGRYCDRESSRGNPGVFGRVFSAGLWWHGERASNLLADGDTVQVKDVLNTCNMDILFEKALGKLKSLLGIEAVASSDRSCSSSDSG